MLSDSEIRAAEDLFRAAGYDRPLRIANVTGDDERIFVVEEDAFPRLPYELTANLQQVLGRKVWIVIAGPSWSDTEPLR